MNVPLRLLVIDDDVNVLRSIEIAIRTRRPDWRVDFTLDCADLLTLIVKNHYDVILSDIKMPTLSGISLLQQVKTVAPMTPVVFLTGYSQRYASAAWELGAFAVLDKPVDLNLLFETLDAAALCRLGEASDN
ncbi:MAG TPA: response regulator [Nitrospirales bacterium]|nr:response regulator [Nitrospirales bacterium]